MRTRLPDIWHAAPETPQLGADVVHVWRAELALAAPQVQCLLHTLADDERARAQRFYFARDRDRFIVARGVLRNILARYLETSPEKLRFTYGTSGKPDLESPSAAARVRFNLSHSSDLAVYAVTLARQVGVDVERLRAGVACEAVADRFFSPGEAAQLRALPQHLRPRAFFCCWTRKEAYIKARGQGLFMSLGDFDVSLVPGESAALVATRPDSAEAGRWSIKETIDEPHFVGALAAEGHGWCIERYQWTPHSIT